MYIYIYIYIPLPIWLGAVKFKRAIRKLHDGNTLDKINFIGLGPSTERLRKN